MKLLEGPVKKGGQNEIYQITERPGTPAPMRPSLDEPSERQIAVIAAWLQKGHFILGRHVMHPVEGGDRVARVLAEDLLKAVRDG